MELLQLQYFRKVAQVGNLTQAARELHISQPALSQTIAKLEKDLGVPLFDREGRRIRLNAYGKAFLEEAEKALDALEEGRRKVADMAGLERGVVFLDTTFPPHFPEILGEFLHLHPDVRFQFTQANSRKEMEDLLMGGRIDCCVSCRPVEQCGVCNAPVKTEDIVLAVPAGHRWSGRREVDLREAAGEPFVGFKREHPFRSMTDELCRSAGFLPKTVCEADETPVVAGLVRAGLGVALLPESAAEEDDALRHVHIREPAACRTYYLAWREDRYASKAAAAFREFIIRRCSAVMNKNLNP